MNHPVMMNLRISSNAASKFKMDWFEFGWSWFVEKNLRKSNYESKKDPFKLNYGIITTIIQNVQA